MLGHGLQHMAECRAYAVVVLPEVHEHWLLRVSRATVRALVLSEADCLGYPTTRT